MTGAILAALSACGAGTPAGDTGAGVVVHDSAGIRIIENSGDGAWSAGEAWTLSAAPVLEIGALSGPPEYQLYGVAGALRLSDGRIVIANSGTSQLRYYDSSGEFLHATGREGGGPGEFEGLAAIRLLPGDTVAAWDRSAKRLSYFGPGGEFAGVTPPVTLQTPFLRIAGILDNGSFVLRVSDMNPMAIMMGGGPENGRESVRYLRIGRDGAIRDTLGPFPGSKLAGGGHTFRSLPFSPSHELAVGDDAIYGGVSGRMEIRVYAPGGRLRQVIRSDRAPLAVTETDRAEYERIQLERIEGMSDMVMPPGYEFDVASEKEEKRAWLDDVPFPEFLPYFSDFVIDGSGNLWVRAYNRPGDDQPHWTIFDSTGRRLGTLSTPAGLEITQIGSDYVLGVTRGELDVERVRLYELIKS